MMLTSLVSVLGLKWSTWLLMHRRLLMKVLLIVITSALLFIFLYHPLSLYSFSFHRDLPGPGCGPNCILHL